MNQTTLPVAVIGAGPVGLAAAAHLISKGETPIIFEAGAVVGASVLQWGHVRVFSPWRLMVDAVARHARSRRLAHAARRRLPDRP